MHGFEKTAIKLLKNYKLLTRRQYSPEESKKYLGELSLNGKLPKYEVNLYRLLLGVEKKLSHELSVQDVQNIRYSGAKEFLEHLKDILDEYQLSGNKVINVKQAVSRELIKAVQLMSLPEDRLTDEHKNVLYEKARLVARFGNKDQKAYLSRSFSVIAENGAEFFAPVAETYKTLIGYSNTHNLDASQMLGEPA